MLHAGKVRTRKQQSPLCWAGAHEEGSEVLRRKVHCNVDEASTGEGGQEDWVDDDASAG